MNKKDGGPAYPVTPTDNGGQIAPTEWGMSLRDWFAGMALQGLLSNSSIIDSTDRYHDLVLAACDYADAMIREREDERAE